MLPKNRGIIAIVEERRFQRREAGLQSSSASAPVPTIPS